MQELTAIDIMNRNVLVVNNEMTVHELANFLLKK